MAATTRIRLRVFMALALLALVLLSAEATQNLKKTTCPLCDMDVRAEINAPVLGGQHIYACEMAGHIDQLQNEPSKNLGKPVAVDLATDAIYKDATELSCAVCGKPFAALKYAVPWISMGSQKILTCSEEHALEVFNNPTKYVGTSEMAGGFCNHGSALVPRGSVMFNGFQLAIGEQATCALLLFQPWILTSGVKYAFGFLGVVLMAMSVELIGLWREKTEKQLYAQHGIVITAADYFQMQTPGGNSSLFKPNERTTLNATGVTIIRRVPFWCRIVLAGFYVANLTIAYFLMLIIMMYESLFFIAVVLGLGLGFFFFKDTEAETMSGHVDPCCST